MQAFQQALGRDGEGGDGEDKGLARVETAARRGARVGRVSGF